MQHRESVLHTLALLAVLRPADAVASLLVERACAHLRADRAALLASVPDSESLELRASCGAAPPLGAPLWCFARGVIEKGRGARGPDLWESPGSGAPPRSCAVVPLAIAGARAALGASGPAGDGGRESDLWLLAGLAQHGSIAFANAAELERRSDRDALTGLGNHGAFWRGLGSELRRAQRYAGTLSVVLFDLDGFKLLNDRCGHLAGDRALREVARALRESSRDSDVVARYGGEEFAVVLPQTPLEGALAFAAKVVERVRGLGIARGADPEGPLTTSAGAVEYEPGQSARALVAEADRALYRAKRAGGDGVCSRVDAGGGPPG